MLTLQCMSQQQESGIVKRTMPGSFLLLAPSNQDYLLYMCKVNNHLNHNRSLPYHTCDILGINIVNSNNAFWSRKKHHVNTDCLVKQ